MPSFAERVVSFSPTGNAIAGFMISQVLVFAFFADLVCKLCFSSQHDALDLLKDSDCNFSQFLHFLFCTFDFHKFVVLCVTSRRSI